MAFVSANVNSPFGFKPLLVDLSGGPVGVGQYAKPASDTNAIFQWDLVRKVATSAAVEGQLLPTPSCQSYSTGTPGTTLILGSSLNFGAASQATWHTVCDDLTGLYAAQTDSTTTSIAVASSVGKNANVTNTAQTSTLANQSVMSVAASSIATTATLDLRIRDFYRSIGNSENPNAILEVLINKHQYTPGVVGV